MPTYRENVTDKDQADLESANDDSAIRVMWWKNGTDNQVLNIKAYDLQAQGDEAGSPSSAIRKNVALGITTHNDKPGRFDTPGKA